eukprot:Nk52_evm7s553 gene=Nk52_evmTU7s553
MWKTFPVAKVSVPDEFEAVLLLVTREALRHQPDDFYPFAAQLLKSELASRANGTGDFLAFLKKGEESRGRSAGSDQPAPIEPEPIPEPEGAQASSSVPVVSEPAPSAPVITETVEISSEPTPVPAATEEVPVVSNSLKPRGGGRRRRQSVSAEVVDMEKNAAEKTPFYEKSELQTTKVTEAISENFLFKDLDEEQVRVVVGAMFEKKAEVGELVIEQGCDGDNFYVVEDGEYEIHVAKNGAEPFVFGTLGKGGSFGELALMYNTPRAATIKCIVPGTLWALDRVTFRSILMNTSFQKRRKYESFIESVPLLEGLDPYERAKIADSLKEERFEEGEKIIRQGEVGSDMYFVLEGQVRVSIHKLSCEDEEHEISILHEGQYFGELALVTKKPRAATCTAVGHVKVAKIERDAFERLICKCEDVMKRGFKQYETELKAIFDDDALCLQYAEEGDEKIVLELHKHYAEDHTLHHLHEGASGASKEVKSDTTTEATAVAEAPAEEAPAEEAPAEEAPAEEAPAEETPAEETPAEDVPAEETPAEETPAEDVPAEETPAEEAPAEEAPAEEAPAEEAPAEEAPAEEAPAEEAPAEEAPAEEAPAEEAPAEEAPAEEAPAEEAPAEEAPAEEAPAEEAPAEEAPAEEAPAEEAPAEEAPAEEAPAEEAPAEEAPAEEAPAEEAPAEEAPAEEAPAEEAPAEEAPAEEAPAEEAPAEEAPAEEAPAEDAPAEDAPVEEAPAE